MTTRRNAIAKGLQKAHGDLYAELEQFAFAAELVESKVAEWEAVPSDEEVEAVARVLEGRFGNGSGYITDERRRQAAVAVLQEAAKVRADSVVF